MFPLRWPEPSQPCSDQTTCPLGRENSYPTPAKPIGARLCRVIRGGKTPCCPGELTLFTNAMNPDIQAVNYIGRQAMSHKHTTPKTPVASSIPAAKEVTRFLDFDDLPATGFVRQSQLVQNSKRPDRPAPLPFSAPTLWRKVKAGTFPAPVKLSERVTAWKVGTVRAWMSAQVAL